MRIIPYEPSRLADWEKVVDSARNATFLHRRNFMDYHADRFADVSLIVCDDAGKVLAALPASRDGETVTSHAGLTYGGLLMPPDLSQAECLRAFEAICAHLRTVDVKRFVYKPVPHVFHRSPAEEDLYAVHRLGGVLVRRDVSTAVKLDCRIPYSTNRKRNIKKARSGGLQLCEGSDYENFHILLSAALERHGAKPVHSLSELRLLSGRFPQNIRLFEARNSSSLLAGVVVFDFGHAAHTQYLATSEAGGEVGALDLLIDYLLGEVFASRSFFSFGISTEQQGKVLNEGLQRQKEGFGARAVVHDVYQVVL